MKADAAALRQQKLMEIEHSYRLQELGVAHGYQTSEQASQYAHTDTAAAQKHTWDVGDAATQNEQLAAREKAASERAAANADFQTKTDANGKVWQRKKGTTQWEPTMVNGEQMTDIPGGGGGANATANMTEASWLVHTGIEPDLKTAYKRVTTARADPTTRARLKFDVYKQLKADDDGTTPDAELQQRAETQVEQMIVQAGGDTPAAPSSMPTGGEPQDAATAVAQANAAIAAAIAKGADEATVRQQVRDRLVKMHIDPDKWGIHGAAAPKGGRVGG